MQMANIFGDGKGKGKKRKKKKRTQAAHSWQE
jgi:hypothetical protein